jgi:polysaccharide biosynthesis transport protein
MDLNQFMQALRARRRMFALVMLATIVSAVAVALILPKKYVSSASVLVDVRDEQSMSGPGLSSPRERVGYLQTQVDIITSNKVANMVVRDLKLAQIPEMRERWESDTGGAGSLEEWLAGRLLARVKVGSSTSSVITISYSASDPKRAADVANSFARSYMQAALALRTQPTREAAEWFDDQLKALRAQVGQAQAKLAAYQREKGIVVADDRYDYESARLAELSMQYLAARNATYDATTRQREANDALKRAGGADVLPEVLASSFVGSLKGDLVRAEARLQEMGGELGPNHPQYRQQQQVVRGLRDKVGAEAQRVVAGLNSAAAQHRRREGELKAAVTEQQQRILAMKDARIEMAVLARDVESAQRAYDAALSRAMVVKVESRAKQTNIAMLSPALEATEPAHPRIRLIGLLALFGGALFAAGAVFMLETLDRRVRSRFDLESRLAVPSLGGLSRWQPSGGRLLPAPVHAAHALPHPW